MSLINCNGCGAEISSKAKICPKCGRKYPRAKNVKCKECGAIVSIREEICPNCGIEYPASNKIERFLNKHPFIAFNVGILLSPVATFIIVLPFLIIYYIFSNIF